jgi:hypothetical protein
MIESGVPAGLVLPTMISSHPLRRARVRDADRQRQHIAAMSLHRVYRRIIAGIQFAARRDDRVSTVSPSKS